MGVLVTIGSYGLQGKGKSGHFVTQTTGRKGGGGGGKFIYVVYVQSLSLYHN